MVVLLAGDIGGTNSRFTVFVGPATSGRLSNADHVIHEHSAMFHHNYKNDDFHLFDDVMEAFLADAREAMDGRELRSGVGGRGCWCVLAPWMPQTGPSCA